MQKPDSLQGSLDLLVLKILSRRPRLHGYAIMSTVRDTSGDVLHREEGSLYPPLHRMEEAGWIRAEWIVKDTGRRARIYQLTAAGRKQLAAEESRWETVTSASRTRFAVIVSTAKSRKSSSRISKKPPPRAAIRMKPGALSDALLRQREESREVPIVAWLDSLRADTIFGL
jgi:transcriptional regulator